MSKVDANPEACEVHSMQLTVNYIPSDKQMSKLEEIEKNGIDTELSNGYDDVEWLINRVKKLEEALREVLPAWESDFDSVSIEMGIDVSIDGNEVYQKARKVLED